MDITATILSQLEAGSEVNSSELARTLEVDHQMVVGAVKSLQALGEVISAQQITETAYVLTEEGKTIINEGSHEFRILSYVPDGGILENEVLDKFPFAKIGLSKALALKWVKLNKTENGSMVERLVSSVTDSVRDNLINMESSRSISGELLKELKKRKLISETKRTIYLVSKGPNFSLDLQKEATDISPDMLLNGTWRTTRFKPYNFNALGAALPSGNLHPLLSMRSEFCRILIDMGFSEMQTNNYVECSFWNFDSLFQPQQHPARDAQDTFFIADPSSTELTKTAPPDYIDKVRTVHSLGAFGSRGYQSEWLEAEAEKNVLRTHTTASSARLLYASAKQNPFVPLRCFSIDRVFRNETLDATHLAEFHQVEGVIADYGLGLGHLKAVIRAFFSKLGLTKLRFKPAYNPYTEPSMEIFAYHPGLLKWVEIGNSGIFRPEMLRPMGLPDGITAIAWGLSLERPTMIRYGYKNIRDLIGPRIDLTMVYNAPLCRLDKDNTTQVVRSSAVS